MKRAYRQSEVLFSLLKLSKESGRFICDKHDFTAASLHWPLTTTKIYKNTVKPSLQVSLLPLY